MTPIVSHPIGSVEVVIAIDRDWMHGGARAVSGCDCDCDCVDEHRNSSGASRHGAAAATGICA
jgi:hypothetical protein